MRFTSFNMKLILFGIFLVFYHVHTIDANCVLNVKDDLTANHPLILSSHSPKWVSLEDSSIGNVNIGRDDIVRFACASKKNVFRHADLKNTNVINAKCKSGKSFEVNGKVYDFRDLHCETPVEVSEKNTAQECLGKDTELIKVGYDIGSDFITEYEVCFEKKEKHTLYTEVVVPGNIEKSVKTNKEYTWLPKTFDQFKNIDMKSAYTCSKQAETFKKILNKEYFDSRNQCCLDKTKLVTEDDMMLPAEKASTSHYLNAVPQWSTCNKANWKEVEKRVNNLAKTLRKPLKVWTGTYRKMTLPAKWGFSYKDMYLHYNGDSDKAIPVPLYIWKVVYEPESQKAVAVIEINNPHLQITDVDSLVLCEDICKNVDWLNFLERKTIRDGYVYCCDLHNFEFGFHFKNSPFPAPRGGILRNTGSNRG